MGKLLKASTQACKENLQHLFIVLTEDGRMQINGSLNFVNSVNANEELLTTIHQTLSSNVMKEGEILSAQVLDYPLLPCSPFSPEWKGSAKIRGILTAMLSRLGYCDGGAAKKLGLGDAPHGWPANILPWADFKGATRSKLTVHQVTEIIVSMMRGAGLNPETHVAPPPDAVLAEDITEVVPEGEQEEVVLLDANENVKRAKIDQDDTMDEEGYNGDDQQAEIVVEEPNMNLSTVAIIDETEMQAAKVRFENRNIGN